MGYRCSNETGTVTSVTYSYVDILCDKLGQHGLYEIDGKTGEESIPILESAINCLKDDETNDRWEATEGNVKRALRGLLEASKKNPNNKWSVT